MRKLGEYNSQLLTIYDAANHRSPVFTVNILSQDTRLTSQSRKNTDMQDE